MPTHKEITMPLKNRLLARLSCVAAVVAATAAVAPLTLVSTAHAAAPQVRTSAPGYYRMLLGDFEITALSDGTVALPVDKRLNQPAPKTQSALAKSFQKAPLETSVTGYLVNTGSKLVLVDTGAAGLFGPTLGRLAANLKAAGYQPEQVDEIYITHMHPDHVGGLMVGEQRAFPNAVVRADQKEADFWLSQTNLDKAPDDESKGFFKGAMASLNPYVKAGKFKPFSGNTDLVPGIKALASHGHTPGHTTYVVESQGQKLALLGDLILVAAVQFDDPSVTIQLDSDSKSAAVERKKAFADAAKGGYLIAAAHLSFPGIGHIRAEGKGYRFVPVNYSVVNPK
ncbi:MBL fold metallo-hydrolase [Caballeronia zhejiangensis]|uniref:MBL fold metallo-hydrolase n=1 Tax=Caballeronia zhejiangensis TaxID=871203 RepID=UPI0009DDF7C3|nr:MBL fold metallo-hydrolase [Caballeronia zhejiangensis]